MEVVSIRVEIIKLFLCFFLFDLILYVPINNLSKFLLYIPNAVWCITAEILNI